MGVLYTILYSGARLGLKSRGDTLGIKYRVYLKKNVNLAAMPYNLWDSLILDGMLGAGISLPHWLLEHNLRSK